MTTWSDELVAEFAGRLVDDRAEMDIKAPEEVDEEEAAGEEPNADETE